ncbi:MAG: thiolase domain-containing protein [Firmicutes bacterium]|jgi:acetyl-CoA C-acetyltransferase|nr:thiolase domain-containing protein [Bacillota bacterium]NLY39193.1 thiolase domain-containing protein [Bacillota bacterium]
MRKVSVIGAHEIKWGVLKEKPLLDMVSEAANKAITDAGIDRYAIQAIFLGNAFGEILTGQATLGSATANILGIPHVPSIRFECACSSGAIALREAFLNIAHGVYDYVLVVGVEKMNTKETPQILSAIATSFDFYDQKAGIVAPAVFALYASAHMKHFGTTKEQLAMVAEKNYYNGSLNPNAHYQKQVSLEEILNAPMIAEPLGRHDCSLVTDGAAALVLGPAETAKNYNSQPINILASAIAGDYYRVANRDSYVSFASTRIAARQAYEMAGVQPQDITCAETHDCFTITEIINIEDLGFFPKGEGGRAVQDGETRLAGRIPVNASGGLKAKGHAIGATGVGQVVEAVTQLRGKAGERQIKNVELFLTHMLGGSPSISVIHIFARGY